MSHKKHLLKEIIIPFLPFVVLYFLFNYLPIEHWVGSEVIYLLIKLAVYGISTAGVIYFKHKLHVEIEVPQRQISLLWLIPLKYKQYHQGQFPDYRLWWLRRF